MSRSVYTRLSDWIDARQRGARSGVGLYLRGGRACRVTLRRQGGVLSVVGHETVDAAEAVRSGPPDNAKRRDPLGVTLADLHGFHRVLTLPPADLATTRKLAAVQLEAILPGQQDVLRWSVQRTTGPHRRGRQEEPGAAVLFATSQAVLDRALAALPAHDVASLLTVAPLALDALLQQAGRAEALADRDVVLVEDTGVYLLGYRDGSLVSLSSLEREELADPSPEALAEAIHEALAGPASGGGGEVSLLADPAAQGTLAEVLRTRHGVHAVPLSSLLHVEGLDAADLAQVLAAGAAAAALEPGHSLNLSPRGEVDSAAVEPVSGRQWLTAAAWLVLALVGWYAVDLRTASVSREAVEGQGLSLDDVRALDTQLAVNAYLEKAGPTFFIILDELSQKTSGFQVDSLRFERQGQLTLRGNERSGDAVSRIAADMAKMQTLGSVQVRSLSQSDRDRVSYTIVAEPNSRYAGSFVNPPRPPVATPRDQPGPRVAPPSDASSPAEASSPQPGPRAPRQTEVALGAQ